MDEPLWVENVDAAERFAAQQHWPVLLAITNFARPTGYGTGECDS
jgi:hypothetical protein